MIHPTVRVLNAYSRTLIKLGRYFTLSSELHKGSVTVKLAEYYTPEPPPGNSPLLRERFITERTVPHLATFQFLGLSDLKHEPLPDSEWTSDMVEKFIITVAPALDI